MATERAKAILGPCVQSLHTRAQEPSRFAPSVTFNSCLCFQSTDKMMENVDLHPKIKHQASFGMTPVEAGQLNSMAWWALSICTLHSSLGQRGGLLLT